MSYDVDKLPVVYLTNDDFLDGTFRIRSPGKYILDEDIVFDPIAKYEAKRTDKPLMGWFSIISIETQNFIIDLNGYTIGCSQYFVDTHYLKAFATILLNNSIYEGDTLFNTRNGFIFNEENSDFSAQYGTIMNGQVRKSPYFGIKGSYNCGITLSKLSIEDFEFAGVWLTSPQKLSIDDVKISGNKHPIKIRSYLTSLFFLKFRLRELVEDKVQSASKHLLIIDKLFEDECSLKVKPNTIPDHTVHGLMINNGLKKDFIPKNININNLFVENLTNKIEETVSIGTNPEISANLLFIGLFGSISFENFFIPETDHIRLTQYQKALLFTIRELQHQENLQIIPNIFINELLESKDPVFRSDLVFPILGNSNAFDHMYTTPQGIYGINIYCTDNLLMKRIRVRNIKNISSNSLNYEDIAGIGHYPDIVFGKHTSSWSWGILINGIIDSKSNSICVRNITSIFGRSLGIHLSLGSRKNTLESLFIRKIISKISSIGVFFQEQSSDNKLTNAKITCIDIGIGSDKTSKDNYYENVSTEPNS